MIDIKVTAAGQLVVRAAGAQPSAAGAKPSAAGAKPSAAPEAALWQLLKADASEPLSPSASFWRMVAGETLRMVLLATTSGREGRLNAQLLTRWETAAQREPYGRFITAQLLAQQVDRLVAYLHAEAKEQRVDLTTYLYRHFPSWRQVGQLCFHLGETGKQHEGKPPFGFLATVITGISPEGKPQHKALGKVLAEGTASPLVASLLALIQQLAERETFWHQLQLASPIWKPQYFDGERAYQLLATSDTLASLAIALKLPASWQGRKPAKVSLNVQVSGGESPGAPWLQFKARLMRPDGSVIDAIEELPEEDGLVRLKGKWVAVSRRKLESLRDNWQQLLALQSQGVPLTTALSWLARWSADGHTAALGLEDHQGDHHDDDGQRDVTVELGPALLPLLRPLLNPAAASLPAEAKAILARSFAATLRHYQQAGVAWLYTLYKQGLGGVLADDMGLGKTVQVLALLTICAAEQLEEAGRPKPLEEAGRPKPRSLLVVPTSLLGNWQREAQKFAGHLRLVICHPSGGSLANFSGAEFEEADVVLTTYGMVKNRPELREQDWQLVVLDEAQAIKNPATAAHQAVQRLRGGPRILMTGTPIENSLADLWALMDTCCRPLLGDWEAFRQRLPELAEDASPVKTLIKPFLLRRMKSDPAIGGELPAKIIRDVLCPLSELQTALYKEELAAWQSAAADEAAQGEGQREGQGGRREHILTTLLHLRQICNHPAQLRKDGRYRLEDSGKFYRLAQLATTIKGQGEKLLVFTAYRELTSELAALLARVFGRSGLVLHGGTPPEERSRLVAAFQREDGPPFFVLSLKAGGTGLTITAASHVVHFDRWWNPAIENQATDRAYRIGQSQRVLVHRFICQGTVEDRLGAVLSAKQLLADDIIDGSQGLPLHQLSDAELLAAFRLEGQPEDLADLEDATELADWQPAVNMPS